MKLKTSYKTFIGLLLGAAVLFFLKNYTILPAAMLALGVVSLLIPAVAKVLDAGVSKLLRFVGFCLSFALLFIAYFLVLTPVAWIARLFGKEDSLGLKKPIETNFKPVNRKFNPVSFDKMW